MTTHSDHNDADHDSNDNANDLINNFFSAIMGLIPVLKHNLTPK